MGMLQFPPHNDLLPAFVHSHLPADRLFSTLAFTLLSPVFPQPPKPLPPIPPLSVHHCWNSSGLSPRPLPSSGSILCTDDSVQHFNHVSPSFRAACFPECTSIHLVARPWLCSLPVIQCVVPSVTDSHRPLEISLPAAWKPCLIAAVSNQASFSISTSPFLTLQRINPMDQVTTVTIQHIFRHALSKQFAHFSNTSIATLFLSQSSTLLYIKTKPLEKLFQP